MLYGIDTRATDEIAWLNERFGEDAMFELGGMALTSQAIGPKILWLRRNEPEIYRPNAQDPDRQLLPRSAADRRVRDRPAHRLATTTRWSTSTRLEWDDRFAEPIVELDRLPELHVVGRDRRAGDGAAAAPKPGCGGNAGDGRDGRRGGRGDQRRVDRAGRHDDHVRHDDVFHPGHRPAGARSADVGDRLLLPGLYDIAGGMATSGALTRWFRDQLGGAEMAAEARRRTERLCRAGRAWRPSVPAGSDGVVCLPYFSGERTPINDPAGARHLRRPDALPHPGAPLPRGAGRDGVRRPPQPRGDAANGRRTEAAGRGRRRGQEPALAADRVRRHRRAPRSSRSERSARPTATRSWPASPPGSSPTAPPSNAIGCKLRPCSNRTPTRHAIYDEYYRVYRGLYEHAKDELHELSRLGSKTT